MENIGIDPIHGYIELDDISLSIIDTPQFQRLRDLKQLGTLYYVFPGATHNRFEHSLGVGYLAGCMVDRFREYQPELKLTSRESGLLRVAGLVHDLGHGPFSHVFDNEFMARRRPGLGYNHEIMSCKMLDYLIDENQIEMEADEVNFVKELVFEAKRDKSAKRMDSRKYLYQIVANGKTGIDVDKFDYLARDTQALFGTKQQYSFDRIWTFNKVIGDEICYNASAMFDLYDLFYQRYRLHKQIYSHRKGKAIEYMICDAMMEADHVLGISNATETAESFSKLTDHIIRTIEYSDDVRLDKAKGIIERIRKRKLYVFVDEYLVATPELAKKIPKVTSIMIANHCTDCPNTNLTEDDIVVFDNKLNYNLKDKNPINEVQFYSSNDMSKSFHTRKQEFSHLIPDQFQERVLRVYCKSQVQEVQHATMLAFRAFLRQFTKDIPPPSPSTKIASFSMPKEPLGNTSRKLFMPTIPENNHNIPEDSRKRLRKNS